MNAIATDGNLPVAKRFLADAIHTLAGRTTTIIDGVQHWGDSLYNQLRESVPGAQGTQFGGVARSMPPLWVDAADLLQQIDRKVEVWERHGGWDAEDIAPTVYRLYLISDRDWRPQDTADIIEIGDACIGWANAIDALLNPAPRWTLPQACPACQTKTVYRQDSAGESVRQPALQIGPNGCECLKCRAVWGPTHFVHLARVLGCELPAGVLE